MLRKRTTAKVKMEAKSFIAKQAPLQGVGVGLRECHVPYLLNHWPNIPWLEIVSDNYLSEGGPIFDHLHQLGAHYPIAMHSVGMSIGSTDSLKEDYFNRLKGLADWLGPQIISDHLCWISVDDQYFHELLPLPYTEEALEHVVKRIKQIQHWLNRTITIENVSSYLTYQESEMSEWEFLASVAERADCGILLDINNIYVSSYNHQFDPKHYLQRMPKDRVQQMHLAGFETKPGYLLDGHNDAVHSEVWALYRQALKYLGAVPTLIEWDQNIPEFPRLEAEALKAHQMMAEVIGQPNNELT